MFRTLVFFLSAGFIVYLLSLPYLFRNPPTAKAEVAVEKVINEGMEKVADLTAEVKAQMPQKTFTPERQVRLTAGIVVLVGLLLGLFISEWFYLFPLFMGMGLISAGLTGHSILTAVLSHMPWNGSF